MDGFDLAKEHMEEILRCAPKVPPDHIEEVDPGHFLVCSSNQENYIVNSTSIDCTCKDFPRVKLCKHVVAIQHYFGGGNAQSLPLSQA